MAAAAAEAAEATVAPAAVFEEDMDNQILLASSWICGIGYTILFGGSMTFQCIVNYMNQSTKGLSSDFALTSFLGFCFYLFN